MLRVGRLARSITMRFGSLLIACDAVPGSARRWCAASVGLVRRGRLLDPRLSLTCVESAGRYVALGWIEPVRGARWLEVVNSAHAERYPIGHGLPVRIASTEVSLDSATFDVTQYAHDGSELERRRVVMHVSG